MARAKFGATTFAITFYAVTFCAVTFCAMTTVVAASEAVVARHQADIEKILLAKTDGQRDQALSDAMAYLETKDSRIGSWIRPSESLPQRYGDLMNAYAYAEFSTTAARIRAGEDLTMKKAEQRLRAAAERLFRVQGHRLLAAWEHSEVTQTRVSTDDIYRLMVDRLIEEDKKFPRLKILEDKKATLAGLHILQQHDASSTVSTEILMKIKSSAAFDTATRARAESVLQTTRSGPSRAAGACQLGFRKFGGG